MNQSNRTFVPISIETEANGQTCIVSVGPWQNKWYLSARFMYQKEDGSLGHSKNGINIRLDGDEGLQAALTIIDAMQTALAATAEVILQE
jgi:hypothetical protein